MPDYSTLSKKKLKRLIAKTEKTLTKLELELEHRLEEAQDDEIDHLDEYMRSAEVNFKVIKDFFRYLGSETRKKNKKKT